LWVIRLAMIAFILVVYPDCAPDRVEWAILIADLFPVACFA
jgi:hypothetical protein